MSEKQKKLSRPEAQMVATFLREEKRIELPGGWVSVWRLTPAEVVRKYGAQGVSMVDVVKAARREVEE